MVVTGQSVVAPARGCFLEQDLFDSLAPGAPHCNAEARNFELGAGGRQISEPVKNKTTDGVDPFRLKIKTKVLAQVIQARVSADQEFTVLQRFDVKIDVSARDGVAQNFFNDIRTGNDSFRAAEFIHHDGQSLAWVRNSLSKSSARMVSGTKEGAINFSV